MEKIILNILSKFDINTFICCSSAYGCVYYGYKAITAKIKEDLRREKLKSLANIYAIIDIELSEALDIGCTRTIYSKRDIHLSILTLDKGPRKKAKAIFDKLTTNPKTNEHESARTISKSLGWKERKVFTDYLKEEVKNFKSDMQKLNY